MGKFNKKEYDLNYHKTHKKQFKVELNINEYEELNQLLKLYNLTKIDFVRNSIKKFKEEKKMKKYLVICETTHFVKDSEGWRYDGNLVYGKNNCKKGFDNIEEASKFYDSIELIDEINGDSRYSDSKSLYEIDESDYNEDVTEIDIENAKIIKDDTLFIDYH